MSTERRGLEPHIKRINVYLKAEDNNRLQEIADVVGFESTSDVIKAFQRLGLQIWKESRSKDFGGLYVKQGEEFVRLPFIF